MQIHLLITEYFGGLASVFGLLGPKNNLVTNSYK